MRKKSRSRRSHPQKTISSSEDGRSQQPKTISSSEHGVIDKGSYTPLSFYMDSAANHPGPICKGYRRGLLSSESMVDKSVLGKNPIPLSLYTTNLVYHPGELMMDIFLDPMGESKLDIFADPMGESIMDVFINSMGDSMDDRFAESMSDSIMGIRLDPKLDTFRPLSFYIDPTVSFTGHKNYIPLSMLSNGTPMDIQSNSSQSKSSFGFSSQSSGSKSVAKLSKDYSPLWFYTTASQMENTESSKSKVSRNSISEEIAFSILSKLSVKSLKRFGCVCKSWSVLFENTDFMTMYTNHFLSRHGSDDHYHTFILANQYFLYDDNRCCYYESEFHLLENGLKFNLPSPLQHSGADTYILGSTSVNGIFCLGQTYFQNMNEQSQYVLWNPLTEEFTVIPSSPTQLIPKDPTGFTFCPDSVFHGFGYDQLRDDFKIIQYLSFYYDRYPRHQTSFFEIYSLKSNSWRMINMENHLSHWDFVLSRSFSGLEVYVDGACHWLVLDSFSHLHAMTLLSFDLSDEVFLTTPIGEEPFSPYSCHGRLTQLNGSIALISNYHDDIVFHISILGELGVSESWIKLYTYGPLPSIQWPLIGFGKMGYIYVTTKDYEVAYVNLNTQIIMKSPMLI
ncbi:hypothetical protein RYX36_021388 [Vicia faba]